MPKQFRPSDDTCVRIENWHLIPVFTDGAPPQIKLQGRLFYHPHLASGTIATTSPVVSYRGNVVETKHRTYHLGEMDRAFREYLCRFGEPTGGVSFDSAYQSVVNSI
jgi:hypothetical protein